MKNKLSPDQITAMWKNYCLLHSDYIGSRQDLLEGFAKYSNHTVYIKKVTDYLSELEKQEGGFFDEVGFGWCLDPNVYRLQAEADFQMRLIELLLPLWKAAKAGPEQGIFFEEIVVRETINPSTSNNLPAAVEIGNTPFILLPMGWFESLHYNLYGAKKLLEGDKEGARDAMSELAVRLIVDKAIYEDIYSYIDADIHFGLISDVREAVLDDVRGSTAEFRNAVGDLPDDSLPDIWGDLAYMALNFVISHEMSHVLHAEQKPGAVNVDEFRADKMGFDILLNANFWKGRLNSGLDLGEIDFAILGMGAFVFSSLVLLESENILLKKSGNILQGFALRAERLKSIATSKVKDQTTNKELLKSFGVLFEGYRELSAGYTSSLSNAILPARKSAKTKIKELYAK